MLKKTFVTPIIMLAVVFVAGCVTKQDQNKIELRWAGYGDANFDKFRIELSKAFEREHPGVTVRYEPIPPSQYDTKILTQLASRTAPDLFFSIGTSELVNRGALLDLTSWVKSDQEYFKKIYPNIREAMVYEGKIYGVPYGCGVYLLYYNKQLFDEANIPYPNNNWTWEDLLETAKNLTKKDVSGKVTQFGIQIGSFQWAEFIQENGGKIWSPDKRECIINSPEAIEALDFWKDLYDKYHVMPSPGETQEMGTRRYFQLGKVAMYRGANWETRLFKESPALEWGAVMIPKPKQGIERATRLIYLPLQIWSGSKHPQLAYELAKFMASPERMKLQVTTGDTMPMRSEGAEMDTFLKSSYPPAEVKSVMLEALRYSHDVLQHQLNGRIPLLEQEAVIKRATEEFLLGKMSASETLQQIEDKLNHMLHQYSLEDRVPGKVK